MEDQPIKPVGENILSPAPLTPRQEELCRRLDSLHALYKLPINPSDIFRGALFAARTECRSNPDWIAQAGNSLRETLYPFFSKQVQTTPKKKTALKGYGSIKTDATSEQKIGTLYSRIQGIAHHGTIEKNRTDYLTFKPEDFDALLRDFEEIVIDALTRQIDVHVEIDEIINAGPPIETATT